MTCSFFSRISPVLFFFVLFLPDASAENDNFIELEMLYWFGSTSRDEVKYTIHTFGGGSVKIQDELGAGGDKETSVAKLSLNLSQDSKLKLSVWTAETEGEAVVDRRIGFDDSVFLSGTTVQSRFKYFTFKAEYNYDVLHYEDKWLEDLYITTGLEYVSLYGSVIDSAVGEDDKMNSGSLAPLIGFGWHGRITENLEYNFAFSGITYRWDSSRNTDHFHQVVSNFMLGVKYTSDWFSCSAGYEYSSFVVGNEMDPDQEREFHVFSGGPYIGFSAAF